jgi:hypothetical protein
MSGKMETAFAPIGVLAPIQFSEQPNDFDLWLKPAKASAISCRGIKRAGKIIQTIAANSTCRPEQIQFAKAKLKESQAGGRRRFARVE